MADISKINVDGTPYDLKDSTKIPASQKGAANGVAELDANGKVPSSQLPSYVDDVLEYASLSNFPATGETGKIYIAKDTNKTYRWSGTAYVAISSDLALGETSSTAYRGDRGKAAYDAAVVNPDSTPTENSTHLIQSGAVHTALAGKVDKNQGSGNAGKVLKVNQNGMVEPEDESGGVDMTGATASTAGTHGLVPAPSAGDQLHVLYGSGQWGVAPGARIVTVSGTVSNTSGSYSGTITDDRISADMTAVRIRATKPEVFGAEPHVIPGNGSLTFSCADVIGESPVYIDLVKSANDTDILSSAEYDALNIRINKMQTPVCAEISRWLRFDPTNRKGLIIKANTHIRKSDGTFAHFNSDTQIDLTTQISNGGKDYFLYLNDDGTFTASETYLNTGVKIGRFHTLCIDAGNNVTMKAPAPPSSGLKSGDYYLVKGYAEEDDPDFYAFYRKQLTTNATAQTQYDVVTVPHPLSGFTAGDILPESVFCITFHPECLVEDAMVYDRDTGKCIDVYLQSGSGHLTRSAYNATHRVSKSPWNHQEDMRMVGKRLLTDHEFTSAALGSNERTNIVGSSDKTYVGGHVDTASRRMISAIGCEEMCGYLWQWLDELGPVGGSSWASNTDGHDSFGQNYGIPYVLLAGGHWNDSSSCGSRSRVARAGRSDVAAHLGGRGSSRVKRGF